MSPDFFVISVFFTTVAHKTGTRAIATSKEDISEKMSKGSSASSKANSDLQKVGKTIDNAFKSSSAADFAKQAGSAAENLAEEFEQLGESVSSVFDDVSQGMAGDLGADLSEGIGKAARLHHGGMKEKAVKAKQKRLEQDN